MRVKWLRIYFIQGDVTRKFTFFLDTWSLKGKKNNLHTHTIIALCMHFFEKLLLRENRKFLSLMTLQMISIELIISQEEAHLVRGCDGAVSS